MLSLGWAFCSMWNWGEFLCLLKSHKHIQRKLSMALCYVNSHVTEVQPPSFVLSKMLTSLLVERLAPAGLRQLWQAPARPHWPTCVPWCCSFLLERCLQRLLKPGHWAQSAAGQSVALGSASNKHFKVGEHGPTSSAGPQQAVCCTEHVPGTPACGTDMLAFPLHTESGSAVGWNELCYQMEKKRSLRRAVLNPALLASTVLSLT